MLYSDQAIKLDATSLRAPLACELGCYVLWFHAIYRPRDPFGFRWPARCCRDGWVRWYTMNYTSGIFDFAKSNLFFSSTAIFSAGRLLEFDAPNYGHVINDTGCWKEGNMWDMSSNSWRQRVNGNCYTVEINHSGCVRKEASCANKTQKFKYLMDFCGATNIHLS